MGRKKNINLKPIPRGWTMSRLAEDIGMHRTSVKEWMHKLKMKPYVLILPVSQRDKKHRQLIYITDKQKRKLLKAIIESKIRRARIKMKNLEEILKAKGYNL